jgi:hypothetical protein
MIEVVMGLKHYLHSRHPFNEDACLLTPASLIFA